jgi:hypothetical protein
MQSLEDEIEAVTAIKAMSNYRHLSLLVALGVIVAILSGCAGKTDYDGYPGGVERNAAGSPGSSD